MGSGSALVGRDAERELVSAVLRGARRGRPSALLVAGEPGIGKTSLVAEVTSESAAPGHLVLWGRCLRFGADSSPYLPFAQILKQWHHQADPDERRLVLTGADDLATIAPTLAPTLGTDPGQVDTARLVPLVADVLDRIAVRRPLVLVVDDVQWADGTSLDLLAYLMAGFDTAQRLGLLITYRDTELGEGHRLHGWLADTVRMPSVSQVRLARLGYADTEEIIAQLSSGEAATRLASQIFTRSAGNPYYTELLVRGAGIESAAGTDGLRHELLGSWHRLTQPARELLQLLAAGGRPVAVDILEQLLANRSDRSTDVRSRIGEAVDAGLVVVGVDGVAWFHHPLVAEVVGSTLTPGARRELHRQYVAVLQDSVDLSDASRAAHLALHHEGAGDPAAAFTWSLRAAEEASRVRGYTEVSDHLQRACRLWDRVTPDVPGRDVERTVLWERASEAAWSAGEPHLAVRMREEAIAASDPASDPARLVRLRLPLHRWRLECGLPVESHVTAARSVHAFAEEWCPDTPEHVLALALLAKAADTHVDGDGVAAERHAEEAVRKARDIGSDRALGWALCMRSVTREWPDDLPDAERALALARRLDDIELLAESAIALANILDARGRVAEAVAVTLDAYRQALTIGSVFDALRCSPWHAAGYLVELGRWPEARELLRDLLSRRLSDRAAGLTRGTAALLAFRSGDVAAGHTHLERARELYSRPLGFELPLDPLWEVEAWWSLGDHRAALTLAARLVPIGLDLDPSGAGELLVRAAGAAADLAQQPGARPEAIALLEELDDLRGGDARCFEATSPEDLVHPARACLYEAERARCHGDPDEASRWRSAVAACAVAGLPWEEARASYRLARALGPDRGARSEVASSLRDAVKIAGELGARPILREAEALALQMHVPLAEPAPTVQTDRTAEAFPELTPREHEVLTHLVAGRTYAEIGAALFISEKTVSVHVSNLLRKTRTSSRIELAELVGREA